MKYIYILAFLIITIGNAAGQQVTFQKTIGGGSSYYDAQSIQQTTDGGYVIAGSKSNFSTGGIEEAYLIKMDSIGNSVWLKTFDGTDSQSYSVDQTTDGGYIIAGYIHDFSASGTDVFLTKTNFTGNILWSRIIGGAGYDYGFSVQQTTDGGYIIAGETNSFGVDSGDVYLVKTNSNGNTLWTKTFGGLSYEGGYDVHQTTDGGYIITGSTRSFGAGYNDIYLIKTNSSGDTLWTKTFGGTSIEYGFSVQQTTDGGYIITGHTLSFGAGTYDVYLIKTDAIGNLLWTKTFGGTGGDYGTSVQQTTDGNYIITGTTYSFGAGYDDIYLIKTNSVGDTIWTKTFGGSGYEGGYYVRQTTDGGYIIIGLTDAFGASSGDIYLIKTDSLGNSGCNQGSPPTITGTPATQVTNPATLINSGGSGINASIASGTGGTVTTLCTTVSFQSEIRNSKSEITISPNPTTNNFTITFPNIIRTATVSICNILGETIFKENIANTSRKEISLTGINAGIYFVKVSADGVHYTQKLVVQQ